MITRRGFLKLIGGGFLATAAMGSYAFAIEPLLRLNTTFYSPKLPNWPDDLSLRVAVLADIHACDPWMSVARLNYIVAKTNDLKPDIVLMLGDYIAGMRFKSANVPPEEWSAALGRLSAPMGVHTILGNHDWWHDVEAQNRGSGPTIAGEALQGVGINVMENDALRLEKNGHAFWITGLGDQLAFTHSSRWKNWRGVDDLDGTLAKVTDDAPVILMAHEPDIFPKVPERVSLTLSGHTHGGQVRLFGYSPVVPSRYGDRYAYGHIVEDGRNLIVSGGLGCSIMPLRFGSPPEIVVLDLGKSVSA